MINKGSLRLATLCLATFLLSLGTVHAQAPYTADVTRGNPFESRGPGHNCNDPGNRIVNCGFETGNFDGWIATDIVEAWFQLSVDVGGVLTGYPGFFASAPTEGSFAALNGFDGFGPGTIELAQDINGALGPGAILSFDYRAAWDIFTLSARLDRTFEVQVQPFGGGVAMQTDVILTATAGSANTDTGNLTGSVDLSAFAGQNVRIVFVWNVPQQHTGPGFFQLDNVQLTDESEPIASFLVTKDFNDNNTSGVDIDIECTTGNPISSSATVYEFHDIFDEIEFKVQDFDDGELDCVITEDVPDGYDVRYCPGDGQACNDTGCAYEEVNHGEAFSCEITNLLRQVEVHVEKVWIDELAAENGNFLFARATWECAPVPLLFSPRGVIVIPPPIPTASGQLFFNGTASDPDDVDSFRFFPHWDGTICAVTESELDSDILSDSSDCQDLEFFPGYEADLDDDDNPVPECTIINTRIYAGIPTLSEYGLALLALLMLGFSFVALRRFA